MSPFAQAFQIYKLDGVGPVDNRPSMTSSATLSQEEEKTKCDMWHVTYDMWHTKYVTCHISHVTCSVLGNMYGCFCPTLSLSIWKYLSPTMMVYFSQELCWKYLAKPFIYFLQTSFQFITTDVHSSLQTFQHKSPRNISNFRGCLQIMSAKNEGPPFPLIPALSQLMANNTVQPSGL